MPCGRPIRAGTDATVSSRDSVPRLPVMSLTAARTRPGALHGAPDLTYTITWSDGRRIKNNRRVRVTIGCFGKKPGQIGGSDALATISRSDVLVLLEEDIATSVNPDEENGPRHGRHRGRRLQLRGTAPALRWRGACYLIGFRATVAGGKAGQHEDQCRTLHRPGHSSPLKDHWPLTTRATADHATAAPPGRSSGQ